MREFSEDLTEYLKRGLRNDERLPLNNASLEKCSGLKVGLGNLVQAEAPIDPFAGSNNISWPFPQLFRGKAGTYICERDRIYTVDESVVPWIKVPITTYDPSHPSDQKAIVEGGSWQMIDFYNTVLFFNGACVVFKTNQSGMFGGTDVWRVATGVGINCGAEFKGRAVYGGFSNGFFNEDWRAIIELLTEHKNPGISTDISLGTNFIFWGRAGGGDLVWPFLPSAAVYTYVKSQHFHPEDPIFLDFMEAGGCGFMPIPFQGTILCMKELGGKLVVYSENGVAVLSSHIEPFPTLGVETLLPIGINSRNSVGGDKNEHIFLDKSGVLWKLTASLDLQRLGYREYLSTLLGEDVLISLDSDQREFYISGSETSFLYTSGLSQSLHKVTSVVNAGGGLVGVREDGGSAFEIETHPFDLKNRSIKTIYGVHVGCRGLENVEVSILHRFNSSDGWVHTLWTPLNKEGIVTRIQSGVEFKLAIRGNTTLDSSLDWIKVTMKYPDKRSARFLDASSASANANN